MHDFSQKNRGHVKRPEKQTDPARTALLIYDGDALAGFAMLNPCSYLAARSIM